MSILKFQRVALDKCKQLIYKYIFIIYMYLYRNNYHVATALD